MSISFTPSNAKDLSAPWIHMFMYGNTGSGKTQACASFPNPLFLVPRNEASIVTLAGRDVEYLLLEGKRHLEDIVSWLENTLAQHGPTSLPETLVIESLSHFMDLLVEEVTRENKGQMDQRGWGIVAGYFRNLQARLRRLPLHVIFTSLAEEILDDSGRIVAGRPLVTGSTRVKLPSSCDIITYLTCAEGKPPIFTAHFSTYRGYMARSRFRGIPASIHNFTYNKICGAFGGQPVAEDVLVQPTVSATKN